MEHLIIKGSTHTLVDSTRNEAMAFSDYGEMVGMVDARSTLLLNHDCVKNVCLLSLVSTGNKGTLDIMFNGRRCLKQLDKPMTKFISELRTKLSLASHIPYRVKHDCDKVIHVIYALDCSTSLEYICKLVDISEEFWEFLSNSN